VHFAAFSTGASRHVPRAATPRRREPGSRSHRGEEVGDPLLPRRGTHDARAAVGLDVTARAAVEARQLTREARRAGDADVAAPAGDPKQHGFRSPEPPGKCKGRPAGGALLT
jgi:hypothetical protein